jgi:hypothetical protein
MGQVNLENHKEKDCALEGELSVTGKTAIAQSNSVRLLHAIGVFLRNGN